MAWLQGSLETTGGDTKYTMDIDDRKGVVICVFQGWKVELTAGACRALANSLSYMAEHSELPEQGSYEHECGARCRGQKKE